MANYLKLGQGLMRHLPQAKGSSSTVKLGKEGIEALAKKNPELGKVIAEFTEGIKNPTLEIAQKVQGNYAIAGFKIRSGETVLGKGAYSTSKGAKGIIEKMHVEKGDAITTIFKEGEEVISKSASKKELEKLAIEKKKKLISEVDDIKKFINELENLDSSRGFHANFMDSQNIELLEKLPFEARYKIRELSKKLKKEDIYCMLEADGKYGLEYSYQIPRALNHNDTGRRVLVFKPAGENKSTNEGIELILKSSFPEKARIINVKLENQEQLVKDLNSPSLIDRLKAQCEIVQQVKKGQLVKRLEENALAEKGRVPLHIEHHPEWENLRRAIYRRGGYGEAENRILNPSSMQDCVALGKTKEYYKTMGWL